MDIVYSDSYTRRTGVFQSMYVICMLRVLEVSWIYVTLIAFFIINNIIIIFIIIINSYLRL